MQKFDKTRIAVIYDLTVTYIQPCNFFHIFIAKLEIPNIKVLLHTLFMNGFWNDNYFSLYVPAQRYLRSSLSVFLSNRGQYRMVKGLNMPEKFWIRYKP